MRHTYGTAVMSRATRCTMASGCDIGEPVKSCFMLLGTRLIAGAAPPVIIMMR